MDRVLITVYFDGIWKFFDGEWKFIKEKGCKAMLTTEDTSFDELSALLIGRFRVDTNEYDIRITHPNTTHPSNRPCDINDTNDVEAFMFVNKRCQIPWSVPLCIILVPKNEVEPMTVEPIAIEVIPPKPLAIEMDPTINEPFVAEANIVDSPVVESSFKIGQTFNSKLDLRNALCMNATSRCFQFKISKSTTLFILAVCIDKKCKWRMRATKLKNSDLFYITKYNDTHSCSFKTRRAHQREASSKLIASNVKSMFQGVTQTPPPKQIMGLMRTTFNIKANYKKCWRAKEEALEMVRGSAEENYSCLPSYMYMLHRVNPGSIVTLEIDGNNNFKYAFVSFGASIRGYQFTKKVLSVDGAFLKAKYGGVLLSAVAQDANMQLFPLAFAVVDGENDQSWDFFFKNLKNFVPDCDEQVFVSDRHKSIKKAIRTNYGESHHGICIYHLKQNIKTRCRVGRIQDMFMRAAKSYRKSEFKQTFDQICQEQPKIGEYLQKAGIKKWSRSYFPSKRYNTMTSNNAESWNSTLVDAREYTIMALFDEIRILLNKWFHERRQAALTYQDIAPPDVQKIMQLNYLEARRLVCRPLNATRMEFEVIGGEINVVVSLTDKTCTCQEFQMEEIPCVHAIAVALMIQVDIGSLVGQYYTKTNWLKVYEDTIYPVPDKMEWDIPEKWQTVICNHPDMRIQPGRKRKTRIPSIGEFKRSKSASEELKGRKCSRCGQMGHNIRTCTNKPK